MSSGEAAGVNIFRRLMFSLPKPLGATVRVSLSPGTSRVWRMAGVLSPVLPRRRGSPTTEHRSRPCTYPWRTPSFTAASKSPWMCRSWPTSAKTTAMPVSWQMGISISRAASRFRHRSQRMAWAVSPVSSLALSRTRSSRSRGSTRLAETHSSRTAWVIALADSSRILLSPFCKKSPPARGLEGSPTYPFCWPRRE